MFSTIGLLTAMICAALAAGIAAALGSLVTGEKQVLETDRYGQEAKITYLPATAEARTGAAFWAALFAGSLVFFVTKLIAYYGMPAIVGPFGGYWIYVLVTLIPALFFGCIKSNGNWRAIAVTALTVFSVISYLFVIDLLYNVNVGGTYFFVILGLAAVFGLIAFLFKNKLVSFPVAIASLVLLLMFVGEPLAYKLASRNAQRFASMAKIKIETGTKMPPSDENHILKVTENMVSIKGHAKLGTWSSQYKEGKYTKQSVNGRRYWIAPLTLANAKDEWNIGSPSSPGYVVVDAEDPRAEAQVKDTYHITLFDDQDWGLNLQRYLYTNGFSDGFLESAKFEVDDNWQPYWVVSYIKRPFGGMTGQAIDKVILVKLTKEGNEISTYDPNNAAERAKYPWVDRVMSAEIVKEYATDWGRYHGDFAKSNFWQVFFGWEMKDTMAPGHVDLCYTSHDENVWIIPMTNTRGSHSVMGVLVYETNRNEATWYPEINGFNISESIAQTMSAAPDNRRFCKVESVQLMSIFGELTWVGIYGSPQAQSGGSAGGSSIGGIGFLRASEQNAEDVVFSPHEATALAEYKMQLANPNRGLGKVSKTADLSKEVTAKVFRIANLSTDNGGVLTRVFKVEGVPHSFLITRDVYQDLPLVEPGDEVTFKFLDTQEKDVPVSSFKCPKLDKMGQEEAATPQK